MNSLALHRETLAVAQRVIDAVDRSQFDLPSPFGANPATYADAQQSDVGASAADRFAAFAGRRK